MKARLLLGGVFLTHLLLAQTYNFRVWGVDEGLPNPYVYDLAQDKNGYLYVATGDGLSTYGGHVFKTVSRKEGLAENFVNTLMVGPRGHVWLGHFQKGISVIKNNKILDLTLDELDGVRITSIIADRDSNIFIGTFGKGVMSIGKSTKPVFIRGLPSEMVTDLEVTSDGKLIVATQESFGIYRLNPQLDNAESIYSPDSISGKNCQQIIRGKGDHFFVTIQGTGILHVEYLQGECRTVSFDNSIFKGSAFDIRDGLIDSEGTLWLASFGEGLKKIIPSDDNFSTVSLLKINHTNGLPTDHLQCLFFDREGNLWIGTYGKGLVQLINERFSLFTGFGNEIDPGVYSVCSDRLGKLWVGTKNGLFTFTPGSGIDPAPLKGAPVEKVTALQPAYVSGTIWAGTESGKVFLVDPESQNVTIHPVSLKAKYIHFIEAVGEEMFISTSAGLAICNTGSNEIKWMSTVDGLLHNNIFCALQTREGKIWIASHETPPYYFFEGHAEVFNSIEELKSFDLNSLAEDEDGNIWIATEGDGLLKYNGTSFTAFTVDQGLGSNFCYNVTCDISGTIWTTHKNGVSRFKKGDVQFEHISKPKGFLSPENLMNAVYADPTGTLFFGTENGLIKYDPRKEHGNEKENITSITGMTLNGKTLSRLNDTIIPYAEYSVRFDYLGICLSDPNAVRYRYKLEGFDPTWTETDHNVRFITYPKLTDGNYTFSLLSMNNTGMWNKKPILYSFQIGMPIWKRWYFFVFCGILLTTVTLLYTRMRTRRLLLQQELLTQRVNEQTLEIRKEKEEVERINTVVEEKNRDITSSINYAVKIQEAMLPPIAEMEKEINGIIYYQPRDIVSGDFFWFHKLDDGSMIVAAADCTGHGVPGAFVSLVGKMLLDRIIIEKKVIDPCRILELLDEGVQESLSQKGDDLTSQDGMELALIRISADRKKVIYSCANRPVLVVRKGELIEFSSSHFGIGGTYGKLQKNYVEGVIEVQPGDMMFIFSDGYADQFGGERGRKFSTKNLKNLLTETANSKLPEQKMIISGTFERWKGSGKQIDDVLLIGLRI